MIQVSENKVTGSTSITVDEFDLSLLRKAVWDEQIFMVALARKHADHRERLVRELNEHWRPIATAIGAGVVTPILRESVEGEDVR